jgi:hypothetical protein
VIAASAASSSAVESMTEWGPFKREMRHSGLDNLFAEATRLLLLLLRFEDGTAK